MLGLRQTLTDIHVSSEYRLFQRPYSSRPSARDKEQSRSERIWRGYIIYIFQLRLNSCEPSRLAALDEAKSEKLRRHNKASSFIEYFAHP